MFLACAIWLQIPSSNCGVVQAGSCGCHSSSVSILGDNMCNDSVRGCGSGSNNTLRDGYDEEEYKKGGDGTSDRRFRTFDRSFCRRNNDEVNDDNFVTTGNANTVVVGRCGILSCGISTTVQTARTITATWTTWTMIDDLWHDGRRRFLSLRYIMEMVVVALDIMVGVARSTTRRQILPDVCDGFCLLLLSKVSYTCQTDSHVTLSRVTTHDVTSSDPSQR